MKVLALLLLLAACASGGGGATSGVCALEPVAVLPVRLIGNVPVTVAVINGRPSALILDIGSDVTLLSQGAARRLQVRWDDRLGVRLNGAGGQARASRTVLPELQLGAAIVPNVRAVVGKGLRPPIDGVLGINVLLGFELDLDVPHGLVMLYRARPCAGIEPNWTGPFTRLPTQQQRSGHLFVPALLNGQPVIGLLDTGASRTTIGLQAAADAGMTAGDLLRGPSSVTQSLDAGGIVVRPRQFRELRVGTDIIKGPVLNVADLPPQAGDLIIGDDYLATRRVWIALATGSMFISTVDQPRPR